MSIELQVERLYSLLKISILIMDFSDGLFRSMIHPPQRKSCQINNLNFQNDSAQLVLTQHQRWYQLVRINVLMTSFEYNYYKYTNFHCQKSIMQDILLFDHSILAWSNV